MELQITTLIEDTGDEQGQYLCEHGLSMYIEFDGKNILFDTGQTGDAVKNAEKIGKSLQGVDTMIISHGHYDHSGGVKKFIGKMEQNIDMFIGKEFFRQKYKQNENGEYYYRGNDFTEEELKDYNIKLNKIEEDVTYISDKIIILKNFKKYNDYEIIPSKFVVKENGEYVQDQFPEELALGLITLKGLVIITGCSHAGIINIIKTGSERIHIPIYEVIGGTHLIGANDERIDQTIIEMKNMGIKKIAVSHCTGDEAVNRIEEEFKSGFVHNNTGNVIRI